MKDNNRETIIQFENSSKEYSPVKNAISEELEAVIRKVYQLDHATGWTLHYLTDIMMNHFHEDVARVTNGDLTPIERSLNGITSRVENTRMVLLKAGYEDKVEVGNPMWYLKLILQDFEHMKKEMKKMQEMTIETALTLITILTPLNIFLWLHLGTYQLHSKSKTKPEGNNTRRLTNANYGAYIQSQGRYYN